MHFPRLRHFLVLASISAGFLVPAPANAQQPDERPEMCKITPTDYLNKAICGDAVLAKQAYLLEWEMQDVVDATKDLPSTRIMDAARSGYTAWEASLSQNCPDNERIVSCLRAQHSSMSEMAATLMEQGGLPRPPTRELHLALLKSQSPPTGAAPAVATPPPAPVAHVPAPVAPRATPAAATPVATYPTPLAPGLPKAVLYAGGALGAVVALLIAIRLFGRDTQYATQLSETADPSGGGSTPGFRGKALKVLAVAGLAAVALALLEPVSIPGASRLLASVAASVKDTEELGAASGSTSPRVAACKEAVGQTLRNGSINDLANQARRHAAAIEECEAMDGGAAPGPGSVLAGVAQQAQTQDQVRRYLQLAEQAMRSGQPYCDGVGRSIRMLAENGASPTRLAEVVNSAQRFRCF